VEAESSNPVILYDGVCGLCNRLVQFVLRHDSGGRFRFASLQNGAASAVLRRHGIDPQALDTMYLVSDHQQPTERLAARSEALILILRGLGGFWRALAALFMLFPDRLRNWFYNLIARNRYRIFGRYATCMLPEEKYRSRFLDV
jgi:predicted DCC family thiol-disulfide oxidoreductase YuxK